MTNKRIAYARPDGGVSIVCPAPGARLVASVAIGESEVRTFDPPIPADRLTKILHQPGVTAGWAESESDFVARIQARDVPADATNVAVVDVSTVPADRTFRNAWKREGTGIGTDMAKAREIHMDRIRAVRDAELARLDVEQLKGRDVTAEKQRLRDLPATFDLTVAATPEDLKALWPAELPRP